MAYSNNSERESAPVRRRETAYSISERELALLRQRELAHSNNSDRESAPLRLGEVFHTNQDIHPLTEGDHPGTFESPNARIEERTEDETMLNFMLVIAILLTTMTVQVSVSPPGGVYQEDSPGNYTAGTAILSNKHPREYRLFMNCVALCFVLSISIIIILASGIWRTQRRWVKITKFLLWLALFFATGIFSLSILMLSGNGMIILTHDIGGIAVIVWFPLAVTAWVWRFVRSKKLGR